MTRKRSKLNIVDVIVLLAIVLAIGYAVFVVVSSMGDAGDTVNVRYVVRVDNVKGEVTVALKEGDKVYSEDGVLLGEVAYCEVAPEKLEGIGEYGNTVYTETDNRTLLVTVDVTATARETGYTVHDIPIAQGRSYKLRSPTLYMEGECISAKTVIEP